MKRPIKPELLLDAQPPTLVDAEPGNVSKSKKSVRMRGRTRPRMWRGGLAGVVFMPLLANYCHIGK